LPDNSVRGRLGTNPDSASTSKLLGRALLMEGADCHEVYVWKVLKMLVAAFFKVIGEGGAVIVFAQSMVWQTS